MIGSGHTFGCSQHKTNLNKVLTNFNLRGSKTCEIYAGKGSYFILWETTDVRYMMGGFISYNFVEQKNEKYMPGKVFINGVTLVII